MEDSWMFKIFSDKFKTLEMCQRVVEKEVDMFEYVPDKFITREMCDRVVEINPMFDFITRKFRTQAMCESVIEGNIYIFGWHSRRI